MRLIFKRLVQFSTVTLTIAGGLAYNLAGDGKKLEASWTTNFEPSVKWDSNWDK
jgi:hypothetical protein